MTDTKIEPRIQVIDRAALLMDAIGRYSKPVKLKALSAEAGLAPSTAYRILQSLTSNRFVERDSNGDYRLGQRLLQLSNRLHSDIDLRAVSLPYMQELCDRLGETINLTIREGDVVIYFEKVTPNRMMHVNQIVGSRAPLHVTAVGKLMLGLAGEEEIESYARRTNLPAYTRNTLSSLEKLEEACFIGVRQGYALDNEEAEIGVGCIGVLLFEKSGNVSAGLSISAPIERRKDEWIGELKKAGEAISRHLGYQPG
ncbi:IclR family transcriptional regulator [Marinobacter sp.]|mgnify:CR=1 FL=1|uniref:IclR family transcriptional regulator n=1 Tax=Marinobacter sp. TaxID=50741 RepID=UPI000C5E4FA6|nr:IclR family transcriptional regulator [Marinobacter sp.]MAK49205.1 IclR family transcriptional regulator [Marinobacter sp.]MAO28517.1 IclR family transcriptional regulator [Roseovarius sp.]MTI78707.1 IclR family transcriptional regulator [Marinobacter sp.]